MNDFLSTATSLVSTLRIIFSGVLCQVHLFLVSYKARWLSNQLFLQTKLSSLPVLSDTVIHFSERPPGPLLGCKRKIFGGSARKLLLKWTAMWKRGCTHVETRGDIWVSHVRCSYLQKDANSIHAIAGMASCSGGMLGGVKTMLMFLFILEMCLNVQSTTGYSVLYEIALIIYSVDYNSWKKTQLFKRIGNAAANVFILLNVLR